MSGKTVTRADLCEAVYQVGLSRTESAALVELVLKEITDCLERGETVKLSSFGSLWCARRASVSGAIRKRQGSADLAAPGDGVQTVGDPQAPHQRSRRAGLTPRFGHQAAFVVSRVRCRFGFNSES